MFNEYRYSLKSKENPTITWKLKGGEHNFLKMNNPRLILWDYVQETIDVTIQSAVARKGVGLVIIKARNYPVQDLNFVFEKVNEVP